MVTAHRCNYHYSVFVLYGKGNDAKVPIAVKRSVLFSIMTGGWDLGSHCGKLELPPVVYGFSLLPPRHSIKKCGDGTSKSWRYGLDVKSSLSFFVIVVCFCFRTCFIFHLACWRANFERQLY